MALLSIIIPTFNSSKTLAACLDSIVCQTFRDLEVWIIDGVSTDDTLNIIQEYIQKHPFIHYISEPDRGIYDAMNKGIDLAKGEWLYFLGSDDSLFDKEVLQKVASYFGETHNYIYGNIYLMNKKEIVKYTIYYHQELLNIPPYHQSIFYRKHALLDLGCYNLQYPIHSDTNISVLFFKNQLDKVRYVDIVIAKYANTGISANQTDSFFHNFLLEIMQAKDSYAPLEYMVYKLQINRYMKRKGFVALMENSVFGTIVLICKLFK